MGKASKWFRGLFGLNKPDPTPNPASKNPTKKKWSFSKSHKEKDRNKPQYDVLSGVQYNDDDVNRQAIAVAIATARVAEAAVAAAQAAAVAVNHTNKGRNTSAKAHISHSSVLYGRRREEWAVVRIQSHFRAYLSRRALRALKGLVKLQALVRGHLMRKRTAEALRQLQALVRAQRRARVGRVLLSESPYSSMKSSHLTYPGPPTPEKFEHVIRAHHSQTTMLKRNGSNGIVNYDLQKDHLSRFRTDNRMSERLREPRPFTSDRILEVDTGKLHITPKRRNLFHSSSHLSLGSDPNCQSFSTSKDSTARSSGEVQSLSPLKFVQDVEESVLCTADNSSQVYLVSSSKKDDYTPTKSDGSKSCFSNYPENYYPSYMGYTESSKAKVRSLSAPKQRPSQYERSSLGKRYSVHGGYTESRPGTQLQANFVNKAYPGSGRLDRLEMPVRGDVAGFSGGLYNRN